MKKKKTTMKTVSGKLRLYGTMACLVLALAFGMGMPGLAATALSDAGEPAVTAGGEEPAASPEGEPAPELQEEPAIVVPDPAVEEPTVPEPPAEQPTEQPIESDGENDEEEETIAQQPSEEEEEPTSDLPEEGVLFALAAAEGGPVFEPAADGWYQLSSGQTLIIKADGTFEVRDEGEEYDEFNPAPGGSLANLKLLRGEDYTIYIEPGTEHTLDTLWVGGTVNFTGEGTLTVYGNGSDNPIYIAGTLVVSGGTLKGISTDLTGVYIQREAALMLDGGNVVATGSAYGITAYGDIVVSNGMLSAQGDAVGIYVPEAGSMHVTGAAKVTAEGSSAISGTMNLTMDGGQLDATGANYGVWIENAGSVNLIGNAVLNARGGLSGLKLYGAFGANNMSLNVGGSAVLNATLATSTDPNSRAALDLFWTAFSMNGGQVNVSNATGLVDPNVIGFNQFYGTFAVTGGCLTSGGTGAGTGFQSAVVVAFTSATSAQNAAIVGHGNVSMTPVSHGDITLTGMSITAESLNLQHFSQATISGSTIKTTNGGLLFWRAEAGDSIVTINNSTVTVNSDNYYTGLQLQNIAKLEMTGSALSASAHPNAGVAAGYPYGGAAVYVTGHDIEFQLDDSSKIIGTGSSGIVFDNVAAIITGGAVEGTGASKHGILFSKAATITGSSVTGTASGTGANGIHVTGTLNATDGAALVGNTQNGIGLVIKIPGTLSGAKLHGIAAASGGQGISVDKNTSFTNCDVLGHGFDNTGIYAKLYSFVVTGGTMVGECDDTVDSPGNNNYGIHVGELTVNGGGKVTGAGHSYGIYTFAVTVSGTGSSVTGQAASETEGQYGIWVRGNVTVENGAAFSAIAAPKLWGSNGATIEGTVTVRTSGKMTAKAENIGLSARTVLVSGTGSTLTSTGVQAIHLNNGTSFTVSNNGVVNAYIEDNGIKNTSGQQNYNAHYGISNTRGDIIVETGGRINTKVLTNANTVVKQTQGIIASNGRSVIVRNGGMIFAGAEGDYGLFDGISVTGVGGIQVTGTNSKIVAYGSRYSVAAMQGASFTVADGASVYGEASTGGYTSASAGIYLQNPGTVTVDDATLQGVSTNGYGIFLRNTVATTGAGFNANISNSTVTGEGDYYGFYSFGAMTLDISDTVLAGIGNVSGIRINNALFKATNSQVSGIVKAASPYSGTYSLVGICALGGIEGSESSFSANGENYGIYGTDMAWTNSTVNATSVETPIYVNEIEAKGTSITALSTSTTPGYLGVFTYYGMAFDGGSLTSETQGYNSTQKDSNGEDAPYGALVSGSDITAKNGATITEIYRQADAYDENWREPAELLWTMNAAENYTWTHESGQLEVCGSGLRGSKEATVPGSLRAERTGAVGGEVVDLSANSSHILLFKATISVPSPTSVPSSSSVQPSSSSSVSSSSTTPTRPSTSMPDPIPPVVVPVTRIVPTVVEQVGEIEAPEAPVAEPEPEPEMEEEPDERVSVFDTPQTLAGPDAGANNWSLFSLIMMTIGFITGLVLLIMVIVRRRGEADWEYNAEYDEDDTAPTQGKNRSSLQLVGRIIAAVISVLSLLLFLMLENLSAPMVLVNGRTLIFALMLVGEGVILLISQLMGQNAQEQPNE